MTNWNWRTQVNTTWDNRTIPSNDWDSDRIDSFLLTEAFNFLLQENWWKIKLDWYWVPETVWQSRIIP